MLEIDKFDTSKDVNLNPVELRRTLRSMQIAINTMINAIDAIMEPAFEDDSDDDIVLVNTKDLTNKK